MSQIAHIGFIVIKYVLFYGRYKCVLLLARLSMGRFRGGTGGLDPLKDSKNIGFLSNTGPDPLKNHKATKPAFIGMPAKRHFNVVILMMFRWLSDDGPLIVVFVWILFPQKMVVKVGPPLAIFSGSTHALLVNISLAVNGKSSLEQTFVFLSCGTRGQRLNMELCMPAIWDSEHQCCLSIHCFNMGYVTKSHDLLLKLDTQDQS